ncbi:hypothetical protein [Lacipirellula parvula]|uniref:Uncharacterized protein n=1 Tax=Lacipirellula parvula TaxID=2650471 RepID=A0A5K7XRC1_9BACT|nr:hypothetical protein [Lacipirellula parvula]BBO36449.1 hypothetical protein PLANPX_6061 [Lacipirellula parvula]
MRLTLRTLLAYMDDVLDPADQEDLGRKIEQSPFATELIHRSRDAVRRLRLSAPEILSAETGDLHGDAGALDANTTSEYLDSTLPPDAVAEFERSCLEAGNNADMLLAEAASCHHILTMVLGEPAEVDADLRQRLYALAQSPAAAQQVRIEPAHATPTNASVTPPLAEAPVAPVPLPVPTATPRKPQVDPDEAGVPDYMLAAVRQRRRTRRALAATLGAFVLGGIAALAFYIRHENNKPVETPGDVAAIGKIDDVVAAVDVGNLETPAAASSSTATADAGATAPAASDTADSEAPAFTPSAPTLPPVVETPAAAPGAAGTLETPPLELPAPGAEMAGAIAAETEAAAAAAPAATPAASTPPAAVAATEVPDASEMTLGPAADQPAAPAADATAAAETPATPADAAAIAATEAPAVPAPPAGAAETPAAETPGPVMVADASASSIPAADAATGADPFPAGEGEKETETPEVKPIGAYLGNNDVLLKLDPKENVWNRVAPRTPLLPGETLLALPTFRTHVVLADANVYLSGGAEVELLPPGAGSGASAAEFGLRIPYGQVVLNSGLNGNRIEISMLDVDRLAQLGPSSSLAIEVRRVFIPGPLANRAPAPAEASWYLTSGSIEWNGEKIEAPATWTTVAGQDTAPVAIDNLPEWVDREAIADSERRARDEVAKALVAGEPVNVHLLELSDPADRGRRTEVRALAARCGAYVGLYDALVNALNDTNQRASWRSQVDSLRQAIARDPSAAVGIGDAFALERGQEAAGDLMEMLSGFDADAVGKTREEVKNGVLNRIVRWMDDDDLTYRVLASYNWDEITGKRLFGNYRPEQTASQRKRALRHHIERLEKGELAAGEAK